MQSEKERIGGVIPRLCLLLLCGIPSACAELAPMGSATDPTTAPQPPLPAVAAYQPVAQPETILPSSPRSPPATLTQDPNAAPFAGENELSVDMLIEQVLARNPSLAQMIAAWQAAAARYPQVTSLDDPMLAGTIGPETIHPDDPGVEFASRFEISQKYPWPGKLGLRGANALAEARAAGNEVETARLQLIQRAKDAFYEVYLVYRASEVNEENLRLLREFRQNAETLYKTGRATEQDLLQADVEIGRQRERQETLKQLRQVAIARINALLNLPPDVPLPPPPKQISVANRLPEVQVLRATALSRRPELQALANRIQAEEAALGLAYKEYYPDFEPFLMYDRFMGNVSDNRDLATMLGVRLNLPVRLARRDAAVAEAQARLGQRRAELAQQVNQVNFEVQQAYAQVEESKRNVGLYLKTVLPAAELNVKAAQSAYRATKIPFLSLLEAERDLIRLRERYYELVTDYFRRLAALERAVGGPLEQVPNPIPAASLPEQPKR